MKMILLKGRLLAEATRYKKAKLRTSAVVASPNSRMEKYAATRISSDVSKEKEKKGDVGKQAKKDGGVEPEKKRMRRRKPKNLR